MNGVREADSLTAEAPRSLATDLASIVVLAGTLPHLTSLRAKSLAMGFSSQAEAAGWSVLSRGDRLHRGSSGAHHGLLVGCTVETQPAHRVADAWSRCGSKALVDEPFLLNGHFAGLVHDRSRLELFTDHVGSVPWFVTRIEDATAWSTDLATLVELTGQCALDATSVRDFVMRGAIHSPFTLFRDVRRTLPASIVRVDVPGGHASSHHYWQPRRRSDPVDLQQVAEVARGIMSRNLHSALDQVQSAVLFYSGGEDSRVLAAICRRHAGAGQSIRGTIFLDHPNRELALARTTAWLLGMPLELRSRQPNHYALFMRQALRLTGGGVDLNHNHAMGLVEPDEAQLFIDGWTADSYLKAWAYEQLRSARQLAPAPPPAGRDSLDEEIDHRQADRLSLLKELRGTDDDARCWMGLWPISDHPDYGNLGVNIRARPTLSPFMLGNLINSIVDVPETEKLDRRLFWRIFGGSMGASGWVPRSGGELPAVRPSLQRFILPIVTTLFRSEDRLRRWFGRSRPQGPWQSLALRKEAASRAESMVDRDALVTAIQSAGLVDQAFTPSMTLRLVEIAMLIRSGRATP